MSVNNTTILTNEQRLGNAMRVIRISKGESPDGIAHKLGYTDTSGYCKVERGEIKDISFWKILIYCEYFSCSLFHLSLIAGLDIFGTDIKTLTEFYKSLSNLTEEEAVKFLEIANKINSSAQIKSID